MCAAGRGEGALSLSLSLSTTVDHFLPTLQEISSDTLCATDKGGFICGSSLNHQVRKMTVFPMRDQSVCRTCARVRASLCRSTIIRGKRPAGAAVIHVWVWATRPPTQTTPLHRLVWTAHHSIMFLNSDLILNKHFVKRVVSAP